MTQDVPYFNTIPVLNRVKSCRRLRIPPPLFPRYIKGKGFIEIKGIMLDEIVKRFCERHSSLFGKRETKG
jgi:hypothetical protein